MDKNTIKLIINNSVLDMYYVHYFEEHPKAKKKPISHPYHESINTWMIMKRPMMNALKQRWKDFIVWFVKELGYKDINIESCEMRFVTYYPSNRRHDIDNSTPKFIIDGLCESGMIIDDDCKHITKLTLECGIDKDDPRTEIYITKN